MLGWTFQKRINNPTLRQEVRLHWVPVDIDFVSCEDINVIDINVKKYGYNEHCPQQTYFSDCICSSKRDPVYFIKL